MKAFHWDCDEDNQTVVTKKNEFYYRDEPQYKAAQWKIRIIRFLTHATTSITFFSYLACQKTKFSNWNIGG